MKKLLIAAALVAMITPAFADDMDLTYKGTGELATFSGSPATGDLALIYDASANAWKTKDATAVENGLTSIATTTNLTSESYANKTLVMGGAGTLRTFTLPAATGSGDIYKFVVGAVNTSKYIIDASTGAATIDGGVFVNTDNGSDAVVGFTPGASDDVVTLNGTTTGGAAIGDYITLQDIAEDQWTISGMLTGSGSEVNPSSAAAQ